jgi:hypothetical protein
VKTVGLDSPEGKKAGRRSGRAWLHPNGD